MFDYPPLALDQERADARGSPFKYGGFGLRQNAGQ
jgi:hypothetical protein